MGDVKQTAPELSAGKKMLLVCVGIVATIAVVVMGSKIYYRTAAENNVEMTAQHENVTVSIQKTAQNPQPESTEPKSGLGAVMSSLDQSQKKISNPDCDYSLIHVSLDDDTSSEDEQSAVQSMKEKVKQAAWDAGVTRIELVEERPTQLYYQMSPKHMLGRLLRSLNKTGLTAGIAPDAIAPAC